MSFTKSEIRLSYNRQGFLHTCVSPQTTPPTEGVAWHVDTNKPRCPSASQHLESQALDSPWPANEEKMALVSHKMETGRYRPAVCLGSDLVSYTAKDQIAKDPVPTLKPGTMATMSRDVHFS